MLSWLINVDTYAFSCLIPSHRLLFSPRECVVKLGVLSSVRSMHSLPFDPIPPSALHYTAPELLYTSATAPTINWRAADCWSVGCVLAEILLGRPLFEGCRDSVALLRRVLSIPSLRPKTSDDIVANQLPVLAAAADSLSYLQPLPAVQLVEILPEAGAAEIDLIARLMSIVPQYRITVKQGLDHVRAPGCLCIHSMRLRMLFAPHATRLWLTLCPLGMLPRRAVCGCGGEWPWRRTRRRSDRQVGREHRPFQVIASLSCETHCA